MNRFMGLLLGVLAVVVPLLSGCNPAPAPSSPGYVDAGPNAQPAKKGAKMGESL